MSRVILAFSWLCYNHWSGIIRPFCIRSPSVAASLRLRHCVSSSQADHHPSNTFMVSVKQSSATVLHRFCSLVTWKRTFSCGVQSCRVQSCGVRSCGVQSCGWQSCEERDQCPCRVRVVRCTGRSYALTSQGSELGATLQVW